MKKYISSADNMYNLKELIEDKDEFLEAIGFTWVSDVGMYAGILGTGLVLYSPDGEDYFWIRNGAEYADEIFTDITDGKLGLDEATEELDLDCREYSYFEEV